MPKKSQPSMYSQWFPPKPKFWQKDIPDLSGKVTIVTGAKTGVGKETVKALLQHNAKVYLAARGKKQTEEVIEELYKVTGKRAIHLELDLASFKSIKKAAAEFLSKESELHILFNNAGIMWPSLDMLTEEGYDAQWGVHVVGNHLWTKSLLPALEAGAKTSADGKSRVVSTSSSAAYLDVIHWDTFVPGPARTKFGTQGLYSQSKFGQVVWTREFAKRYGSQNILAFSCNPGNLETDLQRHMGGVMKFFIGMILHPVDPYGPLTQLYAGTSPAVLDHPNGSFYIPWAREGPTPPKAIDDNLGKQLWEYLEKEVSKA
ncbi:NAD-P-bindingprotein [Moniliophthora roreri MCA 2997]|uniref:NAD-P-bindingprotein n=2 Tax=Moniliophthora roreri TaxID=221103 RepID=V2WYZ0_MONRO|nr:NAD-P-bindingprotein [Moniliophthora roreri MCA 2997]KAI3621684.1 NAD-P-bindingprotein [Moniliophthora roreri]